MFKSHVRQFSSHRSPLHRVPAMGSKNFFAALQGLSLDDSPVSSPSAVAAAKNSSTLMKSSSSTKRAQETAAATAAAASSSSSYATVAGTSAATTSADGTDLKPRPSKPKLSDPLVWIDLEMTGLDVEKDTIIEIACLVTDGSLKQVVEGPSLAIHHPESVLASMNEWCQDHHAKSGLVQRVRDSTVSLQEAEQLVLEFVKEHTEYKTAQLAGNSIHVDRMFLTKYMPELIEHLHYRIVDVSTFKECCRRWKPKLARHAPRKVAAHTALSDIKESLKELQYYKSVLFK